MDIALAVEKILPAAEYLGSTSANTKKAWDDVRWTDKRMEKPTWDDLQAAWPQLQKSVTIKQQIAEIEAQVTPRRQREAVLGIDDGWMADLDDQIATLRTRLAELNAPEPEPAKEATKKKTAA